MCYDDTSICPVAIVANIVFCFAEVEDTLVTTKDTHSGYLVQYGTPDEVSIEFGILLNEIIEELEKMKLKTCAC